MEQPAVVCQECTVADDVPSRAEDCTFSVVQLRPKMGFGVFWVRCLMMHYTNECWLWLHSYLSSGFQKWGLISEVIGHASWLKKVGAALARCVHGSRLQTLQPWSEAPVISTVSSFWHHVCNMHTICNDSSVSWGFLLDSRQGFCPWSLLGNFHPSEPFQNWTLLAPKKPIAAPEKAGLPFKVWVRVFS